jgi:hypothetical protein
MASPWESLGDKLIEQWLAALLTPAFAFWMGGIGLTLFARSAWRPALAWVDSWKTSSQVLGLLAIVLLAGVSAFVVDKLTLPVLRLLEGYWPAWLSPVRRQALNRRQRRMQKLESQLERLQEKRDELTSEEASQILELEARLLWVPSEPSDLMPTTLGNVLRTAESRPRLKYGLDGVLCWPRLWLVLPSLPRRELSDARARLDAAVQLCVWGVLFCLWGFSSPWAVPIGVTVALFAYRSTLAAGILYGELIDSTYDLYRRELYTALRWPLPPNPAQERKAGRQITEYLFRGSDQEKPTFVTPDF